MQFGIFRIGLAAVAAIALTAAFSAISDIRAQQAATTSQRELLAKGVWSDSVTYAKDDIVTSRGSTWRSLRNNNLNKIPGQTQPSTATSWQIFARGFSPTGAWSNATKYQPDDLATSGGQTYRAKITNTNKQPTNTTNWELLAAKGAPGPNSGVAVGSQSVPAISFSGDGDTGIYSPGGGKIALVENGARFLHNIGSGNTALGLNAISTAAPGAGNTAVGSSSLAIVSSTGHDNTAVGQLTLAANTDGDQNTAVGRAALNSNATGSDNTAIGYGALQLSTASGNTAVGSGSLAANTSGSGNIAIGVQALFNNAGGSSNIAIGNSALSANTNNQFNTAVGDQTLVLNTGTSNSAFGAFALNGNVTGNGNVAVGQNALGANSSANSNVAVGAAALANVQTGSSNIGIGSAAGSSATNPANSIFIGNDGVPADTSTIKIGKQGTQASAFMAGISSVTVANSATVLIDTTTGQLGTVVSSRRYKEDIAPMADVSAMLAKLRPVTFRYKKAYVEGDKPIEYGLIAEEVAEIFPYLAVFKDGQPETVKYHLLPSFLLAGYQAQQKTIATQAEEIAALKTRLAATEALQTRVQRLEALLPQVKAAALQ
jgi:hypothetical protein